jgi:hypothetical protein
MQRQIERAKIMSLLTRDVLDWTHKDMPWRMRFLVEHREGDSMGEALGRLKEWIASDLHHEIRGGFRDAWTGLYLADFTDVEHLFTLTADRIETIQSLTVYQNAREAADRLVRARTGEAAA